MAEAPWRTQGPTGPPGVARQVSDRRVEPPLVVQNAMLTKDKKPFTYTPGGIDLSEIGSPRLARRIERNANAPGVGEVHRSSPPRGYAGPLPPAALAAMQGALPVQVFPTAAPPPPPPPPPVNIPPPPPMEPLPTKSVATNDGVFERPDMTKIIPENPMALLRKTPRANRSMADSVDYVQPQVQVYGDDGYARSQFGGIESRGNEYVQPRGIAVNQQIPPPQREFQQPKQQNQQEFQPNQQNYKPQPQHTQNNPQYAPVRPQLAQRPESQLPSQPQAQEIKTSTAQLGSLYIPPIAEHQKQIPQTPQTPQVNVSTPPAPPQRSPQSPSSPQSPIATLNRAPRPWQNQKKQDEIPPWAQKSQSPPQTPQPPQRTSPQAQSPCQQREDVQRGPQSPNVQSNVIGRVIIPVQMDGQPQSIPNVEAVYVTQPVVLQHPGTRPEVTQNQSTVNNQKIQQQRIQQQQQNIPQQQQQYNQQTQRTVQQQSTQKTEKNVRIIPIQIEGSNNTNSVQRQESRFSSIVTTPATPGSAKSFNRQPSWSQGGPTQSNSFKVIQKMTNTDGDEDDEEDALEHGPRNSQQFQQAPIEQTRKLKLSDDDRELMNKVKQDIFLERDEENPRYRGGHIPSRVFRFLDESVPRTTQNFGNNTSNTRTIPVQIEGESSSYVPPSEQTVQEPKKYTGGKIPSRSFKMLQAMTGDTCANENYDPDPSMYGYPPIPIPPPYLPPPPPPYYYNYWGYSPSPTPCDISRTDSSSTAKSARSTPVPFLRKKKQSVDSDEDRRKSYPMGGARGCSPQTSFNTNRSSDEKNRCTPIPFRGCSPQNFPKRKEDVDRSRRGGSVPRSTPVPYWGYPPYYPVPHVNSESDLEVEQEVNHRSEETPRSTPLPPFWGCYSPFYPIPYSEYETDTEERPKNGRTTPKVWENEKQEEYPAYPMWDPYYHPYYYYSMYPYHFYPPVPCDSEEFVGYSSTDEMNAYNRNYSNSDGDTLRNTDIEHSSSRNQENLQGSSQCVQDNRIPEKCDEMQRNLNCDTRANTKHELTKEEVEREMPIQRRNQNKNIEYVNHKTIIQYPETDTEIEESEYSDTDTETEVEENEEKTYSPKSSGTLQAIRSVSDINVYSVDESNCSDEDTDDTTEDNDDLSVCNEEIPHQLSVIYEESERSDVSRMSRTRESSVATNDSAETVAYHEENLHEEILHEEQNTCNENQENQKLFMKQESYKEERLKQNNYVKKISVEEKNSVEESDGHAVHDVCENISECEYQPKNEDEEDHDWWSEIRKDEEDPLPYTKKKLFSNVCNKQTSEENEKGRELHDSNYQEKEVYVRNDESITNVEQGCKSKISSYKNEELIATIKEEITIAKGKREEIDFWDIIKTEDNPTYVEKTNVDSNDDAKYNGDLEETGGDTNNYSWNTNDQMEVTLSEETEAVEFQGEFDSSSHKHEEQEENTETEIYRSELLSDECKSFSNQFENFKTSEIFQTQEESSTNSLKESAVSSLSSEDNGDEKNDEESDDEFRMPSIKERIAALKNAAKGKNKLKEEEQIKGNVKERITVLEDFQNKVDEGVEKEKCEESRRRSLILDTGIRSQNELSEEEDLKLKTQTQEVLEENITKGLEKETSTLAKQELKQEISIEENLLSITQAMAKIVYGKDHICKQEIDTEDHKRQSDFEKSEEEKLIIIEETSINESLMSTIEENLIIKIEQSLMKEDQAHVLKDEIKKIEDKCTTEENSEDEIDSGVTSDVSRHISDNEEFHELRKMTKYQRAATHSRLFKLLQDECENEEENDEPTEKHENSNVVEGNIREEESRFLNKERSVKRSEEIVINQEISNRDFYVCKEDLQFRNHVKNDIQFKKENLTLPLTNNKSDQDSYNSSGINSPQSPIVNDKLVKELVQSMLTRKKGQIFKSMPLERLHNAAFKILQEELEANNIHQDEILSPLRTSDSTPAQTPQEFYTEYAQYYDYWNSYDGYDIVPSKAFKLIQEHSTSNRTGSISGFLARCPRVLSSKNLHKDLINVLEKHNSTILDSEPDQSQNSQTQTQSILSQNQLEAKNDAS